MSSESRPEPRLQRMELARLTLEQKQYEAAAGRKRRARDALEAVLERNTNYPGASELLDSLRK